MKIKSNSLIVCNEHFPVLSKAIDSEERDGLMGTGPQHEMCVILGLLLVNIENIVTKTLKRI